MTDIDYEIPLKKLQSSIDNIVDPLSILATIRLAEEFYSKDERLRLYAEYNALLQADYASYKKLEDAEPTHDKELDWGQRIKKYGEDVAKEHLSPRTLAQAERVSNLKKLDQFKQEHALIAKLVDAKNV